MNAELLPVEFRPLAGASVQTVNARDLHAFLGVARDFSNWIKDQINRARLTENRDFVKLAEKGELSATGQTRIEYFLTLDAAKHVAMMAGTDKGFEVRDYFIECEQQAQRRFDPASLSRLDLIQIAFDAERERIAAVAQLQAQAPKVEGFDRIANSEGSFCLRDAAKALNIPPMRFNRALQAMRWIYRRVGNGSFVAYQDKLQAGFLAAKITTHLGSDGTDRVAEQVRVTAKGMTKLAAMIAYGVFPEAGKNPQQKAA